MEPLLSADLDVDYTSKPGVLRGLNLDIFPGEIVGCAGQSGSGKSTLALTILRLLPERKVSIRGHIYFRGQDLLTIPASAMRRIRGKEIALALQAASSALNPHLRIDTQMKEAWKAHSSAPWKEGRAGALQTLAAMDLDCDEAFLRRYPKEVSIGQAQRIVLAMALLHRPSLLIADEPTSALDLPAQVELLSLLKKISREFGTAMLFISHDLGAVQYLCDRVCVLNEGKIAETGRPQELFEQPESSFARSLVGAYHALNGGHQRMPYPAGKES